MIKIAWYNVLASIIGWIVIALGLLLVLIIILVALSVWISNIKGKPKKEDITIIDKTEEKEEIKEGEKDVS